jgi:hypothetical protein
MRQRHSLLRGEGERYGTLFDETYASRLAGWTRLQEFAVACYTPNDP